MKHLRLTIEAQGPLSFPSRKPGTQFRESLTYIPGSVLFGVLGQAAGEINQFDAAQFRALRCHNAYAAQAGDAWVHPLPATAQGPKGDDKPYDTLIERLCWEQLQPLAMIYAPSDEDGRPWEARSGFYTIQDSQVVQRTPPEQRVITRAGINRKRGTSQDKILFSPLVLSEVTHPPDGQAPQPSLFVGSIVTPDDFADELLNSIEWIGAHQSTGHGHVKITCEDQSSSHAAQIQALRERIQQLTNACRAQIDLYEPLRINTPDSEQQNTEPWNITGHIFTINLLSDTILLEHGWQPTMVLTAEMLAEITGIQTRLLRSFASYDYAGGWHALWQRPKESHVITRRGSLYVFETDEKLQDTDLEKLYQLQLDGIGERVQEGYGQVRICDEFHIIERQG